MKEHKTRSYQSYFVDKALKQNIIVCLPTGSGKTFIAVQLVKEFLPRAIQEKKKIIILAPSVALTKQHRVYFQSHLPNISSTNGEEEDCNNSAGPHTVDYLTGERNIDTWSNEHQWNTFLDKCHVIVMTPKILEDALERHIPLSSIALLVLDECHHVRGEEPMGKIMDVYREKKDKNIKQNDDKEDNLPRILGLSATIINASNEQSYLVGKEITKRESRMDATAATYAQLEDVLKHATCATVEYPEFQSKLTHYSWLLHQNPSLDEELKEFQKLVDSQTDYTQFKKDKMAGIDHSTLKDDSQICEKKKKGELKEYSSIIKEVLEVVYEELGPACAYLAAKHKEAKAIEVEKFDKPLVKEFYKKLAGALKSFSTNLENFMLPYQLEDRYLRHCITEKLQKLLSILEKYRPESNMKKQPLCAIIFVERRISAQVLSWYFEKLVAEIPSWNFIRPGFIMGSDQSEMYSSRGKQVQKTYEKAPTYQQTRVLERFHSGEINLLVATNVIEEGTDVPACNLVVRFDKVDRYTSFIQSKGRARGPKSEFYAFIDKTLEDQGTKKKKGKNKNFKGRALYEHFKRIEHDLTTYLIEKALKLGVDQDIEDFSVDEEIPPFSPNGTDSVIKASQAIEIVHYYCQTLGSDRLASFLPVAWHVEVEKKFKAYIQLPTNSVIREVIEGDVYRTKGLAKRSVFLKVCELLYKNDALDKNTLRPFPRRLNAVILKMVEALESTVEKDSRGCKVGTKKRTQQYKKKIPECLDKVSSVLPVKKYRLFQLVIEQEPEKTDKVSSSLYRFSSKKKSFGLLTMCDLNLCDIIPKFSLYVNPAIEFVTVSLEEVSLPLTEFLSDDQESIENLYEFERFVFGELLSLKTSIMKESKNYGLIFVPLEIGTGNETRIYWELINKVLTSAKEDMHPIPNKKSRQSFCFNASEYEDAVLVPLYKEDKENKEELFAVIEIWEGSSIHTELPFKSASTGKSPQTYKSYFLDKYPSIECIEDENQPLLRAKQIRNNLNFFTLTKENRKDTEGNITYADKGMVELIPSLQGIHSFPASLYIQSKFLPSILHRISRFLCAREILTFVMEKVIPTNRDKEYEEEQEYLKISLKNSEEIAVPEKVVEAVKQPRIKTAEEDKVEDETMKDEPSIDLDLDYINPNTYKEEADLLALVEKIKASKREKQTLEPPPLPSFLNRSHRPKIPLVDFDSLPSLKMYDQKIDSSLPINPPSLFSIMQAITLNSARDFISLERLETIGDSFLKFAVTKFLFTNFPTLDEGKMTALKCFLVSNAHLYQLIHDQSQDESLNSLKLGEYLAGGIFVPESAFLPPCFTVSQKLAEVAAKNDTNEDVYLHSENIKELENLEPDELDNFVKSKKPLMEQLSKEINRKKLKPSNIGYVYSRINDKDVADSVEALIGAWYLASGPAGAYKFFQSLRLRGPAKIEENILEWLPLEHCPDPKLDFKQPDDPSKKTEEVETFLPAFQAIQDKIGYKFQEPFLLLQALSHPCYMRNKKTPPYERLEFIGDAVLDFLITDHIYQTGNLSPGQLTDLRSALVNNVTFGSLSVRYGLHTSLLIDTSKPVHDAIDTFVKYQEKNGHQVTGHFKLRNDYETPFAEDIEVPKILGDIFESLCGAIYVDSGMSLDTVWKVFYRLIKNEIDIFSRKLPISPVRQLYEKFQELKLSNELPSSSENHQMLGEKIDNKAPNQVKSKSIKVFTDVTEEWKAKDEKNAGLTYIQVNFPKLKIVGAETNKKVAKVGAAKDDTNARLAYIQVNFPNLKIVGAGTNKKAAKVGAAKYALKILEEGIESLKL